jgi:hypothetical protein
MSLLLHTPETHVKGVSNMLFINSMKNLFLERMVIYCHIARPTVVLIPFPIENVNALIARNNNFTFIAAWIY